MVQKKEQKKKYLPVMLDITEKRILIIGGGRACLEKLRSLSQTGVTVDVISPEFEPGFSGKDWLNLIQKEYTPGDLKGYDLVYSGVNSPIVERQIREEAKMENILINFVDNVEFSDFISPSLIQKKFFSIFISTFGKGPGMTKKIRKTIEATIDLDGLDQEAEEYIRNRNK
ncbi:MAG: bifunctional precorrin-2 dehydrogenase/sirohydrochlorin ferrochelatase [Leptospirales bacterium]